MRLKWRDWRAGVLGTALVAGAACVALQGHEQASTARRLSESRHTLRDGIQFALDKGELPLAVRFKDQKGKLVLIVWTAKQGFEKDASYNELGQWWGRATVDPWQPQEQIFPDAERIAKSAYQWTLLALSTVTLQDVLATAEKEGVGTPFFIEPRIEGRTPFFLVFLSANGEVVERRYDIFTGHTLAKK